MDGVRKIRVLIASPGLDGHDRGAKVVARALKDAGMEIVYLGIHRTPEEIVKAAIQEDADFIGLSMLSGAHLILAEQIVKEMAEQEVTDVSLIVGGTIPKRDFQKLKEMGVGLIFPTQTPLDTVIAAIQDYRASRGTQIKEKQVKLYEYEAKKILVDNGIPGVEYPREVKDTILELLK